MSWRNLALSLATILLCAYFAAGAVSRFQRVGRLEISPEFHVEELVHDQEVNLAVGFRNGGTGVLRVDPPIPGCSCALAKLDRSDYQPGETGMFRFTFRPANAPSTDYELAVVVPSSDPQQPRRTIKIRGKMQDSLTSQPTMVRISDIRVGEEWRRQFAVRCTDPHVRLRVSSVSCDLPGTRAAIVESSPKDAAPVIEVWQPAAGAVGTVAGKVTVRTDHSKLRELIVPVEVVVSSRLSVSPRQVLFHGSSSSHEQVVAIVSEVPVKLTLDSPLPSAIQARLDSDESRCVWTLDIWMPHENPVTEVTRQSLVLQVTGLEGEDQVAFQSPSSHHQTASWPTWSAIRESST